MTRIITTTYRHKPPPKGKGRKLTEITGPAVVVGKGGRRPVWEKAAAGEGMSKSTRLETAGEAQPTTPPERQRDPVVITARKAPAPANDDGPRRSAIVTVGDRKTVQRQREQQQMTKLIVTFVPKRQQDARTKYLRLIGQQPEEPPMRPSPSCPATSAWPAPYFCSFAAAPGPMTTARCGRR